MGLRDMGSRHIHDVSRAIRDGSCDGKFGVVSPQDVYGICELSFDAVLRRVVMVPGRHRVGGLDLG